MTGSMLVALAGVTSLVFAPLAEADEDDHEATVETAEVEDPGAEEIGEAGDADTVAAVLRALRLPEASNAAREAGVPEEQVRDVLIEARREGVSAERTQEIMVETTERVRAGDSPESFGQAVKGMIAEGQRGRSLAQSIHARKDAVKASTRAMRGDEERRRAEGELDEAKRKTTAGAKKAEEEAGREAKQKGGDPPEKAKGGGL